MQNKSTDVKATAAAKAAEKTGAHKSAPDAQGAAATAAEDTLSSEGISRLFAQELGDETITDPGEQAAEVQPGAEEQTSQEEESAVEETKELPTEENVAAEEAEAAKTAEEEEAEKAAAEAEGEAGKEAKELPEHFLEILDDLKAGAGVKDIARRIDKVVGQREAEKRLREQAEAKAQQLEIQLTQAQAGSRPPSGIDLMEETDLEKLEGNASRIRDAVENYLDDVATPAERKIVEDYMESERLETPAQLRRQLRTIASVLDKQIPARRTQLKEFRQVETQSEANLKQLAPWAFDKTHPGYAEIQRVKAAFPELKRSPAHTFAAAAYVVGMTVLLSEQAKTTAKPAATVEKPAAKPPPKLPGAPKVAPAAALPPKKVVQEAQIQKANQRNPSPDDVAAALMADM